MATEKQEVTAPAPALAASDSESDDGFGDFLEEEEEADTLLAQDAAAMERKMRTVGVRDGVEIGKEDTLQEGFDAGFASGATRSFRFGALRGALATAAACGLFTAKPLEAVQRCMTELYQLESDTSAQKKTPEQLEAAEATINRAQGLLASVQLQSPATQAVE